MGKTSTDYSGRTFSQSITSVQQPFTQNTALAFQNTSVTGVQKLCEQYATLLLDVLGSNKLVPTQGTNLLPTLISGTVLARGQVQHILNFANSAVVKILKGSETADTPLDEQILNAILVTTDFNQDRLSFTVNIETQAGTSVKFTLPTNLAIP